MYLKDISIKNFLSYGEVPIKYQFDRHQMTMVTAKNGGGKCVDRSTKINVEFMDDDTLHKFNEFIRNQQL